MRYAILISGQPRTFDFEEQYQMFKRFLASLESYDVYILFKMKDTRKMNKSSFEKIINMLQPIYVDYFYDFKIQGVYYSQIKMIDLLIEKMTCYEKALKIRYDAVIRFRPDVYVPPIRPFKMEDYIYTSIKTDAWGNDQFFIINRKMVEEWWIEYVRPTLAMKYLYEKCPDYVIFNGYPVKQIVPSALIRDKHVCQTWNGNVPLDVPWNKGL
jgi:hypothetical protein